MTIVVDKRGRKHCVSVGMFWFLRIERCSETSCYGLDNNSFNIRVVWQHGSIYVWHVRCIYVCMCSIHNNTPMVCRIVNMPWHVMTHRQLTVMNVRFVYSRVHNVRLSPNFQWKSRVFRLADGEYFFEGL